MPLIIGGIMKPTIDIYKLFVIMALASLIYPKEVYAYLDPGTGSYVLQLLIGAILGGVFAIKLFWLKIVKFLNNLFSTKKHE